MTATGPVAYDKITVKQLQEHLAGLGLSTEGTKTELYERYVASFEPAADTPDTPETDGDSPQAGDAPEGVTPPGEYVTKTFTVTDEADYFAVAVKLGRPSSFGYELGAFNGIINSRYDLEPGQIVMVP